MNAREDSHDEVEETKESSSIEDLADAVVSAEGTTDSAVEQPKRRSSRRRGRRGSGRGRGRAEGQQKEQQASVPEAAQTTSQTYEEALGEFENSPRRKRKTRGNSKSDHRPRREDFDKTTPAGKPKPAEKPVETAPEEKTPVVRSTGSRGRRRATRRASTSVQRTPEPTQQQEVKETAPRTPARGRRRATRRRTT